MNASNQTERLLVAYLAAYKHKEQAEANFSQIYRVNAGSAGDDVAERTRKTNIAFSECEKARGEVARVGAALLDSLRDDNEEGE